MIENIELRGAAVAQNVAEAEDRAEALQINLLHHIPGRLRFRSAALKGNACACEMARSRLNRIRGVTSVAANPITGSLLVEYDPATLARTSSARWLIRDMSPRRRSRAQRLAAAGPIAWRMQSKAGSSMPSWSGSYWS